MKRPPYLRPEVKAAVVAFLRRELPDSARQVYREMMVSDPERWFESPHFAGGLVVNHLLRGNGLDEKALGVADLDVLWPELLRLAVFEDETR